MTTIAQPVASSATYRRENVERASTVHDWLVFWLPLALIGVALFLLEHRFHNASEEYWNTGGAIDLVVEAGSSNAFRQVSVVALGAMGMLLLLIHSRLPVCVNPWLMTLIVAICALALLSALWADDGVQSLKRSAIPVLMILAALGIGKHWQPRQLCIATVVLALAYLLIGILAACFSGTFRPTSDYRFTGTLHPNTQGVNCAALCLASIVLLWTSNAKESKRRNWRWLVPLLVGLTFLILTRSRTATMALLAAIFVLLMFGASLRTKVWMAMGLLFIVATIGVLSLETESGGHGLVYRLVQMGREQDSGELNTLTGRIPIWKQVLGDVVERPFFGYGYGGFWTPRVVLQYSHIHNWEFNHAHSAYLETLLGLGLIGLVLGLLLIATSLLSAVWAYWRTDDAGFLFIAAILVFALTHGVLDTNVVTAGFASLLTMICISIVIFQGYRTTQD